MLSYFLNNKLLHGQIDFDILVLIITVKILSRLMLLLLGKVFTLHVTTLLPKVEASWNQLLFNLSSHIVFHC